MPVTLTREQSRMLAALRRMPASRRLYVPDVARLTGLQPETITRYDFDARHRRACGVPRDRDLPDPDGREPRTKRAGGHTGGPARQFWYPGTLIPWIRARHYPGHARHDGRSPLPPGSPETDRPLGRPPLKAGRKPRHQPLFAPADLVTEGTPR